MKIFYQIHKWTSIICALFLFMLIVTGGILLFRTDIRDWNMENRPARSAPLEIPAIWAHLDDGVAAIHERYPGKVILRMAPDGEDGRLYFRVMDEGGKAQRDGMRMSGETIAYDVREGWTFARNDRVFRYPAVEQALKVVHLLHIRMLIGSTGRNILIAACILSLLAILTGLYLYGPMMRGIAFGVIRRNTNRLTWSDLHKSIALLAATWTFLLALTGVGIDLYSRGSHAYYGEARHMAQAEYGPLSAEKRAALPTPKEVLAIAHERYPDKVVVSLSMPEKKLAAYRIELSDLPTKPSNFPLGEVAFIGAADEDILYVPVPTYLGASEFMMNQHVHSHDRLWERIVWAVFALLAAIMVASGIVIWLIRKRATGRRGEIRARRASPWRELVAVVVLTGVVFIAPIYGTPGDIAAAIALALTVALVAWLLRRG